MADALLGVVAAALLIAIAALLRLFTSQRRAAKADTAIVQAMGDDPQLRAMLEDLRKHGAAAATKYMQDEELMAKMGRLQAAGSGPLFAPGAVGASSSPSSTTGSTISSARDDKSALRRRAQQERRQASSLAKSLAKQQEFERQRALQDAEAWEAMQREMAEMDKRSI